MSCHLLRVYCYYFNSCFFGHVFSLYLLYNVHTIQMLEWWIVFRVCRTDLNNSPNTHRDTQTHKRFVWLAHSQWNQQIVKELACGVFKDSINIRYISHLIFGSNGLNTAAVAIRRQKVDQFEYTLWNIQVNQKVDFSSNVDWHVQRTIRSTVKIAHFTLN